MIKMPEFSDPKEPEQSDDSKAPASSPPGFSSPNETGSTCSPDRLFCPICSAPGFERKQKWYCSRGGQLLMTCCD